VHTPVGDEQPACHVVEAGGVGVCHLRYVLGGCGDCVLHQCRNVEELLLHALHVHGRSLQHGACERMELGGSHGRLWKGPCLQATPDATS
jgi:hypothetical protein